MVYSSVGVSYNFLKGREVTLPFTYQSACLKAELNFPYWYGPNRNVLTLQVEKPILDTLKNSLRVSQIYLETSAPIGAQKSNFPPFKESMTDRPTIQPTNQQTGRRGQGSYNSNKNLLFRYLDEPRPLSRGPGARIHQVS